MQTMKTRTKRFLFLLMAGWAVAMLAVACGDDDDDAAASASQEVIRGGTLTVGMLADYNSFDPPQLLGLPDIVTIQHTYDVLVFRNPDLSTQPALATSWEPNEDGSQWTFNLREGVNFSHGKEFTTEDVIYTFNRLFEVESPLSSVMLKPMDIVAVDDHTVRFEFDGPNAVLMESLVKYHAHITPSDVDPERFATETFGTGPFVMTENVIGERTTFERNPNYWWEGRPYVDKLVYIFLPDPETRAEALKAGIIDVIYDLDVSSVPGLEAAPGTLVSVAPTGGYLNLAMDVREAPFDDVRVRQAIQLVTDREAILQGVQFGLGGIAYDHPITATDPVFNESCKPPDYDPVAAKELLVQAGYPNGIDLTLYTSTAGGGMVEMATIYKEKAAPAGINIDIQVVPEDGYWSDVWLQKPFTTVWWGGRPPYEAFSVVYPTDAAWGEAYYSNARVDELLNTALGQSALADRQETFGELQCIVQKEVPRIIPVFRPVMLGLRDDVRGIEPMWDATMSLHNTWLDR